MKMKFHTLKLVCRRSEELLDLSAHVSFFHGQASVGKSSIARLIDFFLGANLLATPAIQQEMIGAQLTLAIGEHDILIERNKGENQLQVSWSTKGAAPNSVLVAARADGPPVVADNIRNLSDLILFLLDVPVIKVRRRTEDPESPLTRLSFRDILKFCYLPQEELDSAFFLLGTPIRKEKSKDVLNYVMGFFSDHLNVLQIEYDNVSSEQRAKELSGKRIAEFLAQFKFGSEANIQMEVAAIANQLVQLDAGIEGELTSFTGKTHFADERRARLRTISAELADAEETLHDIVYKSTEQRELKAELISMKFKTARADSARNVLAGAKFRACPNCGQPVDPHRATKPDDCYLCLQPPKPGEPGLSVDLIRADLDGRINEIDAYLRRQDRARSAQERRALELQLQKTQLDRELSELLRTYETDRLERTRDAERQRATLLERRAFLERLRQLPDAVRKMQEEADSLKTELDRISRQIDEEKQRLTGADKNFDLLEQYFLEALVAIGLPGVSANDVVRINRRTLIIEILPQGNENIAYTFFTAGSGGKMVLITICFALALHRVAAVRSLPLPRFLIIDSPTKNITPDINPRLVSAFYNHLYGLCTTDLANVQIIIIDQTLVEPSSALNLSFKHRLLERGNRRNPPLISYYDGP